jgi:release factor glutamine methyltransferase
VHAALAVLAPGGHLVLEVHAEGAGDIARLVEKAGYAGVRITKDLAGRDRVVEGERR